MKSVDIKGMLQKISVMETYWKNDPQMSRVTNSISTQPNQLGISQVPTEILVKSHDEARTELCIFH